MQDRISMQTARCIAAVWLGLAAAAGSAHAQCTHAQPGTPDSDPQAAANGLTASDPPLGSALGSALDADGTLGLAVHVQIGSDQEISDPLPFLSAAIEPVSFRALRRADLLTDEGLINNSTANGTPANDDLRLSPSVSMIVGRHSALLDGGIAAERGMKSDPLRGFAGVDSNFDLYDLSLRWEALSPGPLELGLLGGVRAIQSVGGMWRTEARPVGPSAPLGITETYDDDRNMHTLPVLGGDVRFHVTDGVTLSTSATTHSSGSSEAFFDMIMQTSFNLGGGVGFHAGYQEVRSAFDDTGLSEPINESGLFARLTIQF